MRIWSYRELVWMRNLRVLPDMMPIAKGLSSGYLPIAGVMISDRIMDVL
ncbi:MAG: hypothetical protein Ct9H300mP28_32790 [Pseudomonadota bacterium]|nr:MAG: hypothetical protein Ct9H300mP28_32790 [Pseudomonadota bacterium]